MSSEKYNVFDSCLESSASSTDYLLPRQDSKTIDDYEKALDEKPSNVVIPFFLSETPSVLRHVVLTSDTSDIFLLNALDRALDSQRRWRSPWKRRVRPIRGFTIKKFVRSGPGHYIPAIPVDEGISPTQVEVTHSAEKSSKEDYLNIKVAARPKCITCHGDVTGPISEGFWSLSSCSPSSDREARLIQKLPTISDPADGPYTLHALVLKELTKQEARGPGKVVKLGKDWVNNFLIYPAEPRRNRLRIIHPLEVLCMRRDERESITSPTELMQSTWRQSSMWVDPSEGRSHKEIDHLDYQVLTEANPGVEERVLPD